MNAPRDPDRLIHDFLMEGATELADPVYDVVRANIDHRPQRVVIGPWRMPLMSKLVPFAVGGAALVAVLVIGSQLLAPAAPAGAGAASTVGGTVEYHLDGGPATTEVTAVADGASVSGTAVTTFVGGTHTVELACANRNGDTWVLAGTIKQTTVPGEKAGHWSVVIVRDGSPQHISIWLSADPGSFDDCDALASNDFSTIGLEDFQPVESGVLVPPPDLVP